MEVLKEIQITYPKIFPSLLCEQLIYYYNKKTNRVQKITMKKLIENDGMQKEVFPTLLEIKNVNIPETNPATNVEPIALFLHYCIKIYEQSKQIKPLNKKDYQKCYSQIYQDAKRIINNINTLKIAGAHRMESIRNSFTDSLNALALSAKTAIKCKPQYSHGNVGMSRKTKDYEHHYFITRLSLHTEELFKAPLHRIIAVTANVIFDKDSLFDENNVKKKLFEFKKAISLKGYD